MSPGRSRRAGTLIGTTFSRKNRSSRKRAGPGGQFEIAVRRGDHAHVDAFGAAAADLLDLALLQRAQDLGLGAQAHVADLVEEQRAAVGLRELAGAGLDRARVAALHRAEQLALDELFGDRGAVHLDERALGALAGVVQRARHQLLAGAALAADQHARRVSAPPA